MKIKNTLTNTALLEEIGRRLAHLRILRGVSQADLARQSGISRFALSRLENGIGGMRIENFLSVLRQLDVLSRMEMVLGDLILSPIQEAEREAEKQPFPKRVRLKKGVADDIHGKRRWGDGIEIERRPKC